MASNKKLKITLIRSVNGSKPNHKLCVKGLGLRRTNHSILVTDSQCVRGLINKASHLLLVEEV